MVIHNSYRYEGNVPEARGSRLSTVMPGWQRRDLSNLIGIQAEVDHTLALIRSKHESIPEELKAAYITALEDSLGVLQATLGQTPGELALVISNGLANNIRAGALLSDFLVAHAVECEDNLLLIPQENITAAQTLSLPGGPEMYSPVLDMRVAPRSVANPNAPEGSGRWYRLPLNQVELAIVI